MSRVGAWGRVAAALAATIAATAAAGATNGPDVTVIEINEVANYGEVGGERAFSIGTDSCNVGNQPVNWCNEPGGCGGAGSDDHPIVSQNLFRLEGGRFQQIGMSWLKHGFLSQNAVHPQCQGGGCVDPPLGGDQLGIGCTDVYDAFLNGVRPLGLRSEANGASGAIVYPYTQVATGDELDQRLRVFDADLDPALHPAALYFLEAHYVAQDDAAAGNARNNASYRRVSVGPAPNFDLSFAAPTVREQAAIQAWQAADPAVELAVVDLPGAPLERFLVARKVSGGAPWHYEYAIQNFSSDRGARRFTVSFAGGTTISNVGFADVDHHSGEVYSTADWTIDTSVASTVTWSTQTFAIDPDANALRWSTAFSFWFDATAGPGAVTAHVLEMFKPGTPGQLSFAFDTLLFDNFETGNLAMWDAHVP